MTPSALPCADEDCKESIIVEYVLEACCNAPFVKLMLPLELAPLAAFHGEKNEIFRSDASATRATRGAGPGLTCPHRLLGAGFIYAGV